MSLQPITTKDPPHPENIVLLGEQLRQGLSRVDIHLESLQPIEGVEKRVVLDELTIPSRILCFF